MKNNKKKGFTLVELLVVIAILAILATVSILGYTSFTGKAKKSVAEQELSQIKTLFLADWLDGFVGKSTDGIAITKTTDGKYTATFTLGTTFGTEETAKAEAIRILKEALDAQDVTADMIKNVHFGDGAIDLEEQHTTGETPQTYYEVTVEIENVVYVQGNGYTAKWNIKSDKIEANTTDATNDIKD